MPGAAPVRVFHAHAAGLDAPDAPGRGAQQEDIAGHALRRRNPRPRVPTVVPSGSATTWYCEVSGMAPPEVMAVRRAPRRPRTSG